MNTTRTIASTFILSLVIMVACTALAAKSETDWPQFRGANVDGIASDKDLRDAWPEGGLPESWRVAIGPGFSGISIAAGRLFTMVGEEKEGEKKEYAVAIDPETGQEIWRTPMGEQFDDNFGNGPRSTPAVDGDLVYVLSSRGQFAALSIDDGKKVWEVDFPVTFESQVPRWGFSVSPLILGDMVYVETGGGEGEFFACFDKRTGERKWLGLDGQPSYLTPLIVTLDGVTQFVIVRFNGEVISLDESGKQLWSHHWANRTTTITTPVFQAPDKFLISAPGEGGTLLMRAFLEEGAWKTEDVWRNTLFKTHFQTGLYHDGYFYGFDNATLKCISAKDGEQAWAKRGFGKGSLIYADDKLYILSDRGQLSQVGATPEAYQEMGSAQALKGKCWTAPTIAGGRLYLRNHTEMVSYDLRKRQPVQ